MSFGTRVRVTDRDHPSFLLPGVVMLACANDRYIVAIQYGNYSVAKVLRADQFEVVR